MTHKWHLSRLDNENLSFHSVSLKHSWEGKDGRCSCQSVCVCLGEGVLRSNCHI